MPNQLDPWRLAGADPGVQEAFVVSAVLADPVARALLERAAGLGLPDWRLVSGAIYQNVWNALTGRAPGHGIKDYDLAYFDASDLSYEAEDRVIRRCAAVFDDIAGEIEVRNQARVHLWFGPKFGIEFPPLHSTDEGITRYASPTHMVGLRCEPDGRFDLFAPRGLDAIFQLKVAPVGPLADAAGYNAKAVRQTKVWREVSVEHALPRGDTAPRD